MQIRMSLRALERANFRRIITVKPEHDPRRAIIREWMALPTSSRKTTEQAAAFAAKMADTHTFRCAGDRYQRILAWLLPRAGKA